MSQTEEQVLHVRISRSSKLVWEGNAHSLSATNVDGPFDILPMHANFLTLLRSEPIRIQCTDGTEQEFTFENAVMYVHQNDVKVYANI